MEWTDLEPDQRLTYLIGDIARSDVFVEGEAGSVFQVIASASANPPEKRPGDLAHLLDSITDMLRAVTLDDVPREMTRQAVIASRAAHRARIGPVHDRWMHHGGQDERWTSVQMLTSRVSEVPATAKNLSVFLKCRDDLLHAGWRMRGVGLILPSWLGIPTFLDETDDNTRSLWTAVALGRFRLPQGPGLLSADVEMDAVLPTPPAR